MDAIYLILGVLGAIGGAVLVWTWGRRWVRSLRERAELNKVPRDWHYETQECGAKISDQGRTWQTTRSCRAVSDVEGLAGLDIGVKPFDVSSVEYSISPSNLALEPYKGPMGYTRFLVKPEIPLRESDPLAFVFECNFVKHDVPRDGDYLSWCSNRRVDWLCQRVLFMDGLRPAKVRWQIVDSAGNELRGGDLTPDRVTGEYRYEFTDIVRDKAYLICWEYDEPMIND